MSHTRGAGNAALIFPDEFDRNVNFGVQALMHRTGERGLFQQGALGMIRRQRHADHDGKLCDAARRGSGTGAAAAGGADSPIMRGTVAAAGTFTPKNA